MFPVRTFILRLWWLCAPLLIGCSALNTAGQNAQPLIAFNPDSPEEVARSFLDAWNAEDLNAMYAQVAARSQAAFPQQAFQDRYTQVDNTLGLQGISYTIHQTTQRGTSAVIRYDALLRSSVFGNIEDPGRSLYLVQENGAWKVAWSPMDILNGMAQDVRLAVSSSLPPRANIYDRSGQPLVQQNQPIKWVAVIKQDMGDETGCINLLARLLLRSTGQLRQLFANYNPDSWFHVGEMDVDVFNASEESLNALCGLNSGNFRKSGEYVSRHYVGQGAVTHITGYIGSIIAEQVEAYEARGYSRSDLVGLAGVELSYQDVLAGRPERVLRLIEPGGTVLRELGGASGADPTPIQLTIDRNLQFAVAQAMNDAFNYAEINWASVSRGAAAVVVDVRTGEILALHSYPTFDPSLFNREANSYTDPLALVAQLTTDRRVPLSNKAVQEQYTPGSIYKLITAIAATDTGTWEPSRTFDCTLEWRGQERYGDALPFRQDWRVVDGLPAAGPVLTAQAIAASCNPFFWEVGALMYQREASLLARYSEQFGLGRRVGLGALGLEAAGSVASPNNIVSAINNAIGQGDVQVNALQFAMAVAAIANEGTLYQPLLVRQVGGFDNTDVLESSAPQVRNQITLPDLVWDTVREGMCLAVTDRNLGTARLAFEDAPYTVCGKTGTAETGPRGSNSAPHGWFVAYTPADDPQIATVVVVTNGREGSETAAPITRRILDAYYGQAAAPFPDWWEGPYVPVPQPEGVTG